MDLMTRSTVSAVKAKRIPAKKIAAHDTISEATARAKMTARSDLPVCMCMCVCVGGMRGVGRGAYIYVYMYIYI